MSGAWAPSDIALARKSEEGYETTTTHVVRICTLMASWARTDAIQNPKSMTTLITVYIYHVLNMSYVAART